jgi:REP element-mobilizing transposase RayT
LVQHIVFRLADSLPAHLVEGITSSSRHERLEAADAALDCGHGRGDLAVPQIARTIEDTMLRFDGDRYALIAWCVMPNHVHALIETRMGHRLDRVLHSWKSFTAHFANRFLGRTGRFWAPEYFDRFMRDDTQLGKTVAYIEANPVSAGLCGDPSEWPFSSARSR